MRFPYEAVTFTKYLPEVKRYIWKIYLVLKQTFLSIVFASGASEVPEPLLEMLFA